MRLPHPIYFFLKKLHAFPEDALTLFSFLFHATAVPTGAWWRLIFIARCYRISYSVDCPHMEYEMVAVARAILNADPGTGGVVVEAGAYKGGSAAKLSWVCQYAKRMLVIFDSFEGMPPHNENHGKNIYGGDAHFPQGSYLGSLDEVQTTIKRFGKPECCTFLKGWFDDTMPVFHESVVVSYLDVDLASSTKTCLKYMYPLTTPNGVLFSQDGHLPLVIEVLNDEQFWREEVHTSKPKMIGLGKVKLVEIKKS